jgi:hypothetical protein
MWTFSVTNAQAAIIAPHSGAFAVAVRENSATPTAVFTAWFGPNPPAAGAVGAIFAAGQTVVFYAPKDSPFLAGQVVGYIQSSGAGPYTFVALESPTQGAFTSGGDLAGTTTSQTVVGLENVPLDAVTVGAPADGDLVVYNGATGKYIAAHGKAVVSVTAAELKDLVAHPKQLVAAPTAGKIIIPVRSFIQYKAGATPYTLAVGTPCLYISWAAAVMVGDYILQADFLNQAANRMGSVSANGGGAAQTAGDGTALVLGSDSDPTLGDGTLVVTVWYRLADLY